MPTISFFFNLRIMMFWNDHAPPHFHVRYGAEEEDTIVAIRTLEIVEGDLKRRARNLVLDGAELHQRELLEIGDFAGRESRLNPSRRWSRAMPSYWNVVSVKPIGPLTLWVEHRDGVKGTVRFEESHLHGVFEKLRDPAFFDQVGISYGAVSWPNEEVDLAPDNMHIHLKRDGEWVLS